MRSEDNRDRLLAIIRECVEDDALQLSDGTPFVDIKGWDSVRHVNFISAVEADFNLRFTLREITEMTSLGAISKVVGEKSRR